MAIEKRLVKETFYELDGVTPLRRKRVPFETNADSATEDGQFVRNKVEAWTNDNGHLVMDPDDSANSGIYLWCNTTGDVSTYWTCNLPSGGSRDFNVEPGAEIKLSALFEAFAGPSDPQYPHISAYVDTQLATFTTANDAMLAAPDDWEAGDLLVATGPRLMSRLAAAAAGLVLLASGLGAAPAYGKVTSAHIDASVATTQAVTDEATSRANADTTLTNALNAHAALQTNPHLVTAAQVGAYTTGAVDSALALKANLAGAAFTGPISTTSTMAVTETSTLTGAVGIGTAPVAGRALAVSGAVANTLVASFTGVSDTTLNPAETIVRISQSGTVGATAEFVSATRLGTNPYFALRTRDSTTPFAQVERLKINGDGGWIVTASTFTVSSDTDASTVLGRARIHSPSTDHATFSHFDQSGVAAYALRQNAAGTTIVNAATGQTVGVAVNNSVLFTVAAASATVASNVKLMISDSATRAIGRVNDGGSLWLTGGSPATTVSGYLALYGSTASPANTLIWHDATTERLRISAGAFTLTGTVAITSDLNVNAGKFLVTASSGDTTIAGALTVQGLTIGLGGGAGASNTAFGNAAFAAGAAGSIQNVAIGYQVLTLNNSGDRNTGLGYQALSGNTSTSDNTAVGYRALYLSNGADRNTGVGASTLMALTSGDDNTAVGDGALASVTSLSSNTAVGSGALGLTVGARNVALGYFAGRYETGSDSFYVDNRNRTNTAGDKAGALLYGTFNATPSAQTLAINAAVTIPYALAIGNTVAAAAGIASTHKVTMVIGGVTYYLLASNV